MARALVEAKLSGQGFLFEVSVTDLSLLQQTNNFSSLKATLEELIVEIHTNKLKIQELSAQLFEIEGSIQCHR